jgi:hypothetical protein
MVIPVMEQEQRLTLWLRNVPQGTGLQKHLEFFHEITQSLKKSHFIHVVALE